MQSETKVLFLLLLCSVTFVTSVIINVDGVLTDWPGHPNCTIGADDCALRERKSWDTNIPITQAAAAAWMLTEGDVAYGRFDVQNASINVVNPAGAAASFIRFCLQNTSLVAVSNTSGARVAGCAIGTAPFDRTHWLVHMAVNTSAAVPYRFCVQIDCIAYPIQCRQASDPLILGGYVAAGTAAYCTVAALQSYGIEFGLDLTKFINPIPSGALSALRVYVFLDNSGGANDDFISSFTWPLQLLPLADISGRVWLDAYVKCIPGPAEILLQNIIVDL